MDKDVYAPLVKNGYMPNGSGAVPFVRENGLTTSSGDDAPAPDNAPTQDTDTTTPDRESANGANEIVTK